MRFKLSVIIFNLSYKKHNIIFFTSKKTVTISKNSAWIIPDPRLSVAVAVAVGRESGHRRRVDGQSGQWCVVTARPLDGQTDTPRWASHSAGTITARRCGISTRHRTPHRYRYKSDKHSRVTLESRITRCRN